MHSDFCPYLLHDGATGKKSRAVLKSIDVSAGV
jgi:hypothetical protein